MDNYQEFIRTTLRAASKLALEHFGSVSSSVKAGDNNQVLTEADLAIGTYVIKRIQATYPDHNIIDEEAGITDNGSTFTWVIDPVDGTSNFAAGVPLYGILLGLLKAGIPIAGGLALPAFNEIYVAAKGKGAYCNGEKVQVSTKQKLSNALVAYGIDGHQENPQFTRGEMSVLAEVVLGIRNLRVSNSTYDVAQVINGAYGASLNTTSKIWDNVAQHIVIEEAGGVYTNFLGEPMDYTDPLTKVDANFTWCAGSPALHAQLQTIIHAERARATT